MFNKSRLMTVGLAVVGSAVALGYLRKMGLQAVKDGKKAEDTIAGKLGLI